jgi:hypothetical protein
MGVSQRSLRRTDYIVFEVDEVGIRNGNGRGNTHTPAEETIFLRLVTYDLPPAAAILAVTFTPTLCQASVTAFCSVLLWP